VPGEGGFGYQRLRGLALGSGQWAVGGAFGGRSTARHFGTFEPESERLTSVNRARGPSGVDEERRSSYIIGLGLPRAEGWVRKGKRKRKRPSKTTKPVALADCLLLGLLPKRRCVALGAVQ
jgi:hypothetical protein